MVSQPLLYQRVRLCANLLWSDLVGSFAALSSGRELEQRVLALHAAGKTDQEIATELTAAGFRSPMRPQVMATTVKNLRLKHRRLLSGHQSHPRHIPGALTIPEVAARLGLSVQWLHYRIKTGRIRPQRDPATGLAVFPDQPRTFELLTQLRAGHIQRVGFTKEYQDA
jgi:predicted DNA-binding transcriptional regulator AlpA